MNLSITQKIIAIVVGIITIGSAAFGIDRYVAKQADVDEIQMVLIAADDKYATIAAVDSLNKRINLNSLYDQLQKVQQRIWQLKDRLIETVNPTLQRVVEELEADKEMLKNRIKKEQE